MMSSYVTEFESQTSNFFCLFRSWPLTKYSRGRQMSPKLARKSGTFAYICSQMYPFWGHLRTLARFWGHLRTLVRFREVCLYFNQNQYQTCKELVETGKTVFKKVRVEI